MEEKDRSEDPAPLKDTDAERVGGDEGQPDHETNQPEDLGEADSED